MLQSETAWVTTALIVASPSTYSIPHFTQRSASIRTINPAWSYWSAYSPATSTWR